ncbi:hypothetical protein CUMW_226130 [Citrus unshiu]|uniref:Uncharacterized protein n=1 Tax=Citrus unshiu TaxID=55188 RepID=A0A2H5QH06_CITUN|nr:hypothetical protein CUMW_226130 [Citrus unshiu]
MIGQLKDILKLRVILRNFFFERFAGSNLGLTIVKQGTAQLVHCFDWELHEGMLPTGLDVLEEFSLVTPWAKHLLAIPTAIFFFLQAFSSKTNKKNRKILPPGPKGFPIFGCLHLLGKFPPRALHN